MAKILAEAYISHIPNGEGMLPIQQHLLSLLSWPCRVSAGVGLEGNMIWREQYISMLVDKENKHNGTYAAALISMMLELLKF